MIKVNLLKVDTDNIDHVNFLYEVIKYRWEHHDIINISYKTNPIVPTFLQHQETLNSGKYKHHYIIRLGDVNIGSCYIDHDDVYGIFFIPKYIKTALKKYKKENTILSCTKDPISVVVFKLLVYSHPEITTFYAKVNPKNTLSKNTLIRGGHKEVELTLAFRTLNGDGVDHGEWNPL